MTPEKYRKRYYLFSGEEHEKIRLDHPSFHVDTFIRMWNENKTIDEICTKLRIGDVDFALLVLDLSISGKIKQRIKGMGILK